MEPLFHIAPYSGAVYPNETVIPWTVLIVIYPYITGLVAGAFTVSSLYHVFGMERFKPVPPPSGRPLLTTWPVA